MKMPVPDNKNLARAFSCMAVVCVECIPLFPLVQQKSYPSVRKLVHLCREAVKLFAEQAGYDHRHPFLVNGESVTDDRKDPFE